MNPGHSECIHLSVGFFSVNQLFPFWRKRVMADCQEQHAAVKFCFLTPAESLVKLKTAYGDSALSKTRVYEWFSRFKNGEMSFDHHPRSGCPSTSRKDDNVAKINSLIREDRRQAIEKLCELSGVSWSSIKMILFNE